jgi:hypothetical protein
LCICQLQFAKLGHCPILKATIPGQHSQIGNSTQQRQVGIPKLATQHNSARSAFPYCQLSSTILPNCQVHFTAVDCPNELQAAHKLIFFQGLNDFFWSAQNFVPEN